MNTEENSKNSDASEDPTDADATVSTAGTEDYDIQGGFYPGEEAWDDEEALEDSAFSSDEDPEISPELNYSPLDFSSENNPALPDDLYLDSDAWLCLEQSASYFDKTKEAMLRGFSNGENSTIIVDRGSHEESTGYFAEEDMYPSDDRRMQQWYNRISPDLEVEKREDFRKEGDAPAVSILDSFDGRVSVPVQGDYSEQEDEDDVVYSSEPVSSGHSEESGEDSVDAAETVDYREPSESSLPEDSDQLDDSAFTDENPDISDSLYYVPDSPNFSDSPDGSEDGMPEIPDVSSIPGMGDDMEPIFPEEQREDAFGAALDAKPAPVIAEENNSEPDEIEESEEPKIFKEVATPVLDSKPTAVAGEGSRPVMDMGSSSVLLNIPQASAPPVKPVSVVPPDSFLRKPPASVSGGNSSSASVFSKRSDLRSFLLSRMDDGERVLFESIEETFTLIPDRGEGRMRQDQFLISCLMGNSLKDSVSHMYSLISDSVSVMGSQAELIGAMRDSFVDQAKSSSLIPEKWNQATDTFVAYSNSMVESNRKRSEKIASQEKSLLSLGKQVSGLLDKVKEHSPGQSLFFQKVILGLVTVSLLFTGFIGYRMVNPVAPVSSETISGNTSVLDSYGLSVSVSADQSGKLYFVVKDKAGNPVRYVEQNGVSWGQIPQGQ